MLKKKPKTINRNYKWYQSKNINFNDVFEEKVDNDLFFECGIKPLLYILYVIDEIQNLAIGNIYKEIKKYQKKIWITFIFKKYW